MQRFVKDIDVIVANKTVALSALGRKWYQKT
jgi:hypothetical protein